MNPLLPQQKISLLKASLEAFSNFPVSHSGIPFWYPILDDLLSWGRTKDRYSVSSVARDGRTIFDVPLGMFRLHMGESEGTSHPQHGVGDHERPVRVARDPAEAEIGPWLRLSGHICENAARAAFSTKWAFWYPQSGIRIPDWDTWLRLDLD